MIFSTPGLTIVYLGSYTWMAKGDPLPTSLRNSSAVSVLPEAAGPIQNQTRQLALVVDGVSQHLTECLEALLIAAHDGEEETHSTVHGGVVVVPLGSA